MALTKVTKSGLKDNSVDSAKIEDGTIVAADFTPGTVTTTQLASSLNLSSKTVTLPNTNVTNAQLAGSIANAKLANSSFTINSSAIALGGSINVKAMDWQTVVTADGSTATTGVAGRGYFINTTAAAHTFTLPGSATADDTIAIKDYAETFGTNNLTINRNGHNIQGQPSNSIISTNRASIELVYVDTTVGWLMTTEANVGNLTEPTFIEATGGTVATSGDYKIHTFTGDGNFVVPQVGNGPSNPLGGPQTISYMVVAGGGGGGNGEANGGGGGGGFREGRDIGPSYTASPLVAPAGLTISAQTYPVTVGAAGGIGSKGGDSVFSTITSAGGGGGGPNPQNPNQLCKARGGSGSGGGRSSCQTPNRQTSGGAGNYPPVSPSQGNPGGSSSGGSGGEIAGGGGGATATGGNSAPGSGGSGGAGATTSISGSPVAYAGGGGGGTEPSGISAGSGGSGGGGAGKNGAGTASSGSANTGGGGGGAGWGPPPTPKTGGSGGKGIVIVRYKFQ